MTLADTLGAVCAFLNLPPGPRRRPSRRRRISFGPYATVRCAARPTRCTSDVPRSSSKPSCTTRTTSSSPSSRRPRPCSRPARDARAGAGTNRNHRRDRGRRDGRGLRPPSPRPGLPSCRSRHRCRTGRRPRRRGLRGRRRRRLAAPDRTARHPARPPLRRRAPADDHAPVPCCSAPGRRVSRCCRYRHVDPRREGAGSRSARGRWE